MPSFVMNVKMSSRDRGTMEVLLPKSLYSYLLALRPRVVKLGFGTLKIESKQLDEFRDATKRDLDRTIVCWDGWRLEIVLPNGRVYQIEAHTEDEVRQFLLQLGASQRDVDKAFKDDLIMHGLVPMETTGDPERLDWERVY